MSGVFFFFGDGSDYLILQPLCPVQRRGNSLIVVVVCVDKPEMTTCFPWEISDFVAVLSLFFFTITLLLQTTHTTTTSHSVRNDFILVPCNNVNGLGFFLFEFDLRES